MKILCFIDSLGSGGAQRQMVTLAKLLKHKGYEISFLVYHREDFFKHYLEEEAIPIHYIIENRSLFRIIKIRKYIRKGGFDTVISFLETPNFLNCIAAIGGKSWKVVTSERSSKDSTFLSIKGKIFGWFQRFSDVLVCNSHNAKTMWEKYYPQYKDKLNVIYNPVILPEITSEYIPKRDGKLHIVVAASYQYLKNPIGLIKALTLLNEEERKKIKVNWYGRIEIIKGDSFAYHESLSIIKEYKLEEVIYLNEETKDIANKMNEADVVALFSELEGLPNAICEGMMIGKPIIMTKVSDYNSLIDSSNGFLCEWDDPKSIYYALQELIEISTNELIELGKQSISKANILFEENVVVKQWTQLINGRIIKKEDATNGYFNIKI